MFRNKKQEQIDRLTTAVGSLSEELCRHKRFTNEKFEQLATNGVATAINKLNAEVFKTRKEKTFGANEFHNLFRLGYLRISGDSKPEEEATLAGKVDAIIAHLGLDVSVAPEEVKAAKVVAKKAPTPKKKGRK